MNIKFAFTLAEVLIVLGILGLIADMTLPTLISKTQEKITVTRVKKIYSTLSAAYLMSITENGSPENWDLGQEVTDNGSLNILNNIAPHLKIAENCGKNSGCFGTGPYRNLHGVIRDYYYSNTYFSRAKLVDGTLMLIFSYAKCEPYCFNISVDINGSKPPNQWGVDFFGFIASKTSLIPSGAPELNTDFAAYCSLKSTNSENGSDCAAWIIYNNNMDYLHCNDLSWSGKKSCTK